MQIVSRILAMLSGRSAQWPAFRKKWLQVQPACQVCGATKKVEVHHIVPVHVDRSMELRIDNLITLCDPHHLMVGHLGSWKSWNETVREDAASWRARFQNRPYPTTGA